MINLIPFEWLIGIGGVLAALLATWFGGRMAAKSDAKVDALKSEVNAHERINDADTGIGATDGERIERLHELAAKHGD